jgi:four helix bundle protein
MSGSNDKYDLEDRLLEFAVGVIRLVESLPHTRTATHVGGQLLRAGTSPLFNHGEAQAAESTNDFVHKMRICLKELRETKRAIRLIGAVPLSDDTAEIARLLDETIELIRIFHSSIKTAITNQEKARRAKPKPPDASSL